MPDHEHLQLDIFSDANCAGLFAAGYKHDPVPVKRCAGILTKFGGIHIHWSSESQMEIALLTLEAKYIALSQRMRELVPTQNLLL